MEESRINGHIPRLTQITKLNQKDIKILSNPVINNEIKGVIQTL